MFESTQKMMETAIRINQSYGSVIPVGKDKKPLINWKEFQEVKATKEQIEVWFERWPEAQLGLLTGKPSNCIVVDIDKKGEEMGDWSILPQNTTIIQTGGGGRHYYFKYFPIGNKASIKPLIDIRGDSGYVIIPPSVTDKGEYVVLKSDPMPDFPAELFGEVKKDNTIIKEGAIDKKETFYILAYPGYGSGQRNHRMTEYIGKVLCKISPDVWDEVAWKLIVAQNRKNDPPLNEVELRGTYVSIAKTEATRLNTGEAKRFHNKVIEHLEPANFAITSTHELMTMDIPEFPYVVENMIPKRAITAITADSGKGKSMVAWILATYIAKGEDVFGKFKTQKQNILYVDQEMDRDLIAERYRSIAKEELPIQFMIEQSWNITNDNHFKWMIDYINENKITMVILDTLTTIHDKEENSASEMREVNKRLLNMIAETDVTVMYLHHHRKPTPGMPMSQSSSRGSTEIMAKIASHFTLDHIKTEIVDYEDMINKKITKLFVMNQEKARRPESVKGLKFEIVYDSKEKKTEWEYMGEDDSLPESIQRACDSIIDFFQTNPTVGSCQTSYIKEKLAGTASIKSIERALQALVEKGLLIKTKDKALKNANFYSLPVVEVKY